MGEVEEETAVADPIGIYLRDLHTPGLTGPAGDPVPSAWHATRPGPGESVLRAVLEVPRGKSHLLLDGAPVKTGGQAAA